MFALRPQSLCFGPDRDRDRRKRPLANGGLFGSFPFGLSVAGKSLANNYANGLGLPIHVLILSNNKKLGRI